MMNDIDQHLSDSEELDRALYEFNDGPAPVRDPHTPIYDEEF